MYQGSSIWGQEKNTSYQIPATKY